MLQIGPFLADRPKAAVRQATAKARKVRIADLEEDTAGPGVAIKRGE